MKRKYKKPLKPFEKDRLKPVPPSHIPSESISLKFLFLSHLLIIVLGVLAYANSLRGQFIYDDVSLIRDNPLIKAPSAILHCFTQGLFAGSGLDSAFFRPLQMASYIINYVFCKFDVVGYHLVNMVLHVLVAISLFWFVQSVFANRTLSCLTSILYVTHPIHTEAVSYISGRCDPMALLFMLWGMILYLRAIQNGGFAPGRYALILLCYAAALFSKEHCLILPALLGLYHQVFRRKIKRIEFFSILGMALIYVVMRLTLLKSLAPVSSTDTMLDRLPGFFVAVFTYIKLLLVPFPLHMEYGQKLFAWTDMRTLSGIFICLALGYWAYRQRTDKIVLFAIGWFFLALLPVSNLYKINFFMAEHFLYIPSVGFFVMIAHFFQVFLARWKYKSIVFMLMTALVMVYMALTIRQNHYWHDPQTFYQMTLKYSPNSSNACNNLGNIYFHQGNFSKAFEFYNEAIEMNPNSVEALNNRGLIYANQRDDDKAIADFTQAIFLNPHYAQAYNNRGEVYNHQSRWAEAQADFDNAIEFDADLPEAYENRGKLDLSQGRLGEAIEDFSKAMELRPMYTQAYEGLAVSYDHLGYDYENKGDLDQAISDYTKALGLDPRLADAYSSRARCYGKMKEFDRAIADFNRSITLDPAFAPSYINRAVAYFFKGEYEEAWKDAHRAKDLGGDINPHFIEALERAYPNSGH